MWNGLFLNSIWHEVFKICYSTFVEQGLWGVNYLGNHWWRVTSFHQINVFVDTTHFCLMVTKKAAGLVFEKNDPYYYNVTCISTNNKDCGVGNFLYSKCSCCNYGEFLLTKLELLSVNSWLCNSDLFLFTAFLSWCKVARESCSSRQSLNTCCKLIPKKWRLLPDA